jgi:hypothetical protein
MRSARREPPFVGGRVVERIAMPDEIVDLVHWIVSMARSFMTGFTFDLSDGRATYCLHPLSATVACTEGVTQ